MRNQEKKQDITPEEVMPTVMKLAHSIYAEDPEEISDTVQEMFEMLMLTDYGNTKATRERAYHALNALRETSDIMEELNEKVKVYV